eukprot:GHVP01005011.1.p1 GENE.GHVP01005011.1~~GHVP01005011.1.p1  ORF type:complete len:407 (-),score=77.80 GHVP01005011.1:1327-2547(-)
MPFVISGTIKKSDLIIIETPYSDGSSEDILHAIGGEKDVIQELNSELPALEFRPNKEDKYSHPLKGSLVNTASVLLFDSSNSDCFISTSSILFKELFDFRFKADHDLEEKVTDSFSNLRRMVDDKKVIDSSLFIKIADDLNLLKNEDNTLIMPPTVFSTHHLPFTDQQTKNEDKGNGQCEWFINFDSFVPKAYSNGYVEKDLTYIQLDNAFSIRPILSRSYLNETILNLDHIQAKKILKYFGYYYKDGPWRACWVKYGISPKEDPKYRIYQTIFTQHDHLKDLVEPLSRKEDRHLFDGEHLSIPLHFIQYCDLIHPEFISYLESQETDLGITFRDGWYKEGTKDVLKDLLKNKIKYILKENLKKRIPRTLKDAIITYLHSVEIQVEDRSDSDSPASSEDVFEIFDF